MANPGGENLIPVTERSKDEARELSKKGGIASGEARREKKRIREALEIALEQLYDMDDGTKVSGAEALAARMMVEALSGNVQAFKEIRDTVGEKPKDEVDVEIKSKEAQEELRQYMELLKNGGG